VIEPWVKTISIVNVKGETVDVDATDVDGFLAAYAKDDNTFWACDSGHIQNVLDEMIDYAERLRSELARHGWGDFHYTPQGAPQDAAIVALLGEHPSLRTDEVTP
jgi:hypothetical protein